MSGELTREKVREIFLQAGFTLSEQPDGELRVDHDFSPLSTPLIDAP